MDERPNTNIEPQSATGQEALPSALTNTAGPPPPLPTRRAGRSNTPLAVPPQPETGAIAILDVSGTGAASPSVPGAASFEAKPPLQDSALEEEVPPRTGILVRTTWNVPALGLASFFTNVAGEMIVPLRMLFLVAVLQTPLALAGLVEGLAESASSLLRIVSGRTVRRTGRRTPLVLFGYSLSAVARPLLAFTGAWQAALGLILLDKGGRGVRSVPRDALLAGSVPVGEQRKVFDFARGMDTLGALVGPLLAFVVLLLTYDDIRAVFAWTVVPGVLSLLVLGLFLRERRLAPDVETATPMEVPAPMLPASALGKRFWMFTAISVVFALGSASEAFIFLRTADLGDSLLMVPLVYFGFNLVYALFAGPIGALSNRFGRLPVLVGGYAIFALVYLGWAVAVEGWNAWALFLIYGIYAAATDGLGRAFVAGVVPEDARSTALAWFVGLVGLAALPANLIAGWLWSTVGPSATFTFGAWAAVVAVALTLAWLPWLRSATEPEMVVAGAGEEYVVGRWTMDDGR